MILNLIKPIIYYLLFLLFRVWVVSAIVASPIGNIRLTSDLDRVDIFLPYIFVGWILFDALYVLKKIVIDKKSVFQILHDLVGLFNTSKTNSKAEKVYEIFSTGFKIKQKALYSGEILYEITRVEGLESIVILNTHTKLFLLDNKNYQVKQKELIEEDLKLLAQML